MDTKNQSNGKSLVEDSITANEAIYGFCSWLTTRKTKQCCVVAVMRLLLLF